MWARYTPRVGIPATAYSVDISFALVISWLKEEKVEASARCDGGMNPST